MMQSCAARGIRRAKPAWWRRCTSILDGASVRGGLCLRGGSLRRLGAVGLVASVDVLGRDCSRAQLSRFCHSSRPASTSSNVFNDSGIGPMQRKGMATEVNDSVLGPTGLENEGSDALDRRMEHDNDGETSVGETDVMSIEEEEEEMGNEFHGLDCLHSPSDLNGAVEAEPPGLSRELIFNSQALFSNQPTSQRKMETEDSREPLTIWPQLPGESERWWRIPDFISEVLPIPRNFNPQLEMLYDKLGGRIHSRELLLRILVHKSYYLLKMPQSVKERTMRKPLMSWQRLETMGDDNVMTFADAHAEARLQLALVGDTVLNLAAALYLIRQYPLLSTGLITERRSQMVCNSNLARAWSTLLDLRELVLCDPPLSQSKKVSATTVLELQMKACADTLEAYIGGLYVEKGLESALQCVETRILPLLLLAEPMRNPVALLHERCVIVLQEKPDYKLIGIDNKNTPNEMCRIRVYVKGLRMSTGIGKSQKLARRDAAEKALLKWAEVFGSTS